MKTTLFTFLMLLTASAHALDSERWNSLPTNPSLLTLQRQGIATRNADASVTLTTASLSSLPAGTGVRVRALLTPTTTGDYTFSISGNRNAALWLSSSDSRFAKQRIAWHYKYTALHQWDKYTTQTSAAVTLTAGTSYYIEAQLMSSFANGHISLGWKTPGSSTSELIPLSVLSALPQDANDLNDNNLPDDWESSTGLTSSSIPNALREFADPDNDGIPNNEEYLLDSEPLTKETRPNGLTRDTWHALAGGNITDIYIQGRTRFFSQPSEIIHAPDINDQTLPNYSANRYRGFVVAPVTGNYRFWIAGNNMCELWFSDGTVHDPTTNASLTNRFGKQRLAYNLNPVDWFTSGWQQFDRLGSQRSRLVYLTAGQPYYIEVLHKIGGDIPSHVSVAWQPPGQARVIIPSSAFQSDVPDDSDLDNDFLPDAWETANTLSTTDNGFTDANQGQFGDFDADGLSNLLEFQYGTNPKSADTDGDSLTDSKEIYYYGTNPLVSNNLSPLLAATANLHTYNTNATTGSWTFNSNGTLSANEQRGAITYSFTLAAPGVHEVTLTGAAIGSILTTERLPIVLSLNGQDPFASEELLSTSGGQGTVKAITPWLAAGNHTITILHDNYRADLRLRIDSLTFHRLGGQDLDSNNIPDWLEQNAATSNALTRVPQQSRTSPASVEGITNSLSTATLNYTPHGAAAPVPATLNASINNTFFSDIPLSESGSTSLNATFLNGLVTANDTIEWIPTNLFDPFTDSALHIRQGDALRLDAWSGASADAQPFTVTLNGTLLADANQNTTHSSGTPFTASFPTAGTYTLVVTHDGQTATVTLHVHFADFGSAFSVRAYSARTLTPPTLGTLPIVEHDERLVFQEITASTGPRKFSANVQQAGNRHVIARLPGNIDGAPSAILSRGTIHGFYLAYLDQTADVQVVTRYDDGTWLMRGTMVAVNLPADILIRLKTEHQGTLFTNGDRFLWLDQSDFDANGIATVYFEWSGTGAPKVCNHLRLYVEQ